MRERVHAALIMLAVAALAPASGCGSDPAAPTAVMLRVDADTDIKRAMRALTMRIYREDNAVWVERYEQGFEIDSRFKWPAELPLVPQEQPLHPFEVVVEAHSAGGDLLAEARTVTSFSQNEITALGLYLKVQCYMLAMPCQPWVMDSKDYCHGPSCKTCRAGTCVAAGSSILPDYQADEDVRELFERSIESPRKNTSP